VQRAPDQEEDESTHRACSFLRNSSHGNRKKSPHGSFRPALDDDRGPIMPGFAPSMTDAQVSALLAFLRAHFSHEPPWGDSFLGNNQPSFLEG
jgi:hypothetical protein